MSCRVARADDRIRRAGTALVGALALLLAAAAAFAAPLSPRRPAPKPERTVAGPGDDLNRVVLKFSEGSAVRLQAGRLVSRRGAALGAVAEVLRQAGIRPPALRRYFSSSERELDAWREGGQRRSGRALADLNLYFELEVPKRVRTAALCDALNALPVVELARPAARPLPPPADLPPITPNLVPEQGYRAAAPEGVGASDAARFPGTSGAGVSIADIEYEWVLAHEDLVLPTSSNIDSATPSNPFPDQGDHGTAVLGVLGARQNGYGVSGLAPAATLLVVPANTVQFGYDPARAVTLAAAVLEPGDVILLEQQTWACADQLGPLEWIPVVFDAVAAATAQGIVVVAAAGNGAADLDAPSCNGWFDRDLRDSGAIIVGAGSPSTHARLSFSSYGSRVDVQGWGAGVTSAGYGDRFDPGDVQQRYTSGFSGTSSASALVAGAVAAIQGAVLAAGDLPLSALEMRNLLTSTGTPQSGTQQIGPLPNLPNALVSLGIVAPASPSCGLGGFECLPLLWLLPKLRRVGSRARIEHRRGTWRPSHAEHRLHQAEGER
jgi:AcrR family transcriptional regulator